MKLLFGNTSVSWLQGAVVDCEVFHCNYKDWSCRAVETTKNGEHMSDGKREAVPDVPPPCCQAGFDKHESLLWQGAGLTNWRLKPSLPRARW